MRLFRKVKYETLNAMQKESFNFQKLSGVLADFGFFTIKLSDDWKGADLIAQRHDGKKTLRIQLKSRLAVNQKYCGKGLWLCFRDKLNCWYLCSHDRLLKKLLPRIGGTKSWKNKKSYSFPKLSSEVRDILQRLNMLRNQ